MLGYLHIQLPVSRIRRRLENSSPSGKEDQRRCRMPAGDENESIVRKKDGKWRTAVKGTKIDAKNIGAVGFLIHPKIQPSILSHEILSPRIAELRLRTEKKATITIVNCYAPNFVGSEEDKDNFYSELEAVIRKEKSYYKYICGDFNALVGNGSDGNWRLGRHGNENRNDNGFRLLDLMCSCNLFHGNSIFEKRQHRRWTWESPNGQTHSELDHILTNRRWSLMDVTVLPSFVSGSDHRLLRGKIRLNEHIFKRDTHIAAHPHALLNTTKPNYRRPWKPITGEK
ncbi:endonuclease/exonuclease/phosphatase family protein [Ancylostoma duodenale]|uniref:Endonuclease/exonuclease/phosphatase family protein n=1 Tax=Ancylostoma duodenale TaxID=51022 RepID=A0A0C2HCL5_9BILA|nr:endonuclease/exonuclease/phosphatase family protein [Ancylostoma duodenale]